MIEAEKNVPFPRIRKKYINSNLVGEMAKKLVELIVKVSFFY